MSDQEILEKAIKKAIDGGWILEGFTDEGEMHFTDTGVVVDWLRGGRDAKSINDIIFNHDFAKALWGEEWVEEFPFASEGSFKYSERQQAWKKHLQNMVVSDDPIKYLGENI